MYKMSNYFLDRQYCSSSTVQRASSNEASSGKIAENEALVHGMTICN